jgi:hypothetical protein
MYPIVQLWTVGADNDMLEIRGQGWVLGDVDQGLEAVGGNHELLLAEELVREEAEDALLQGLATESHIAEVGGRNEVSDSDEDFERDLDEPGLGLGACWGQRCCRHGYGWKQDPRGIRTAVFGE